MTTSDTVYVSEPLRPANAPLKQDVEVLVVSGSIDGQLRNGDEQPGERAIPTENKGE
jgi:hypothetical protein